MSRIRLRYVALTWAGVILLAACAADDADDADEAADTGEAEAAGAVLEADEVGWGDAPTEPSGEPPVDEPAEGEEPDWPWHRDDRGEDVTQDVPLEEIRHGGPPPDGIPPIDDPVFETVDEAGEWLEANEPIMIAEVDGQVRGYPLGILTFHEIVNDTIAGEPVVVTYCPLCNSGFVFEREVDGQEVTFGTSGRLWHSNLVMYDRATRSLWAQFTGEAIVGERTGARLERLPMQIVSFEEFAATWPDAPMLSRETGHDRPYGNNPYTGYEGGSPFLFDGETEGPLAQMDRVVAAGGDTDPVAYPWQRLEDERVIHDDIDGEPAVVLWAPGAASAVDAAVIAESDDVGQAAVFSAVVDGEARTFEPAADDGRFVDDTGTVWTVSGRAVDGPDAGAQLERLPFDDTFWFVQYAFLPETRVEQ